MSPASCARRTRGSALARLHALFAAPLLHCGDCSNVSKTVWPSGLRRWLKAPVHKGVGSNPTAVTCAIGCARPIAIGDANVAGFGLHALTALGFEPTPWRIGAWSQRLRPLGQTVMAAFITRKHGAYSPISGIRRKTNARAHEHPQIERGKQHETTTHNIIARQPPHRHTSVDPRHHRHRHGHDQDTQHQHS